MRRTLERANNITTGMGKKVYICCPHETDEQIEKREYRIAELAERISEMGMTPVWCAPDAKFGQRLSSVVRCDAILLDLQWKTCMLCVDEYNVAANHKKAIYHTREEYDWIYDRFVI
ncbi:MAG: hypothetical protein MJZ30_06250 [Paludibacteraceae bacterium]|nr:hypothetical protein [Paludibacteraceae bacterium]